MNARFLAIVLLSTVLGCSSESSTSNNSSPSGTSDGSTSTGGNCPDVAGPSDGATPSNDTVQMPGGETGIGFDDLIYSARSIA